jgi:hypothetical protein
MNDEKKTICSVKSSEWPWRYTFVLTTDSLTYEWTKPFDVAKGAQRYALADLSPQLSRQMEFGRGTQPLRKAVTFLAASVCVFFSQFNSQIPLLAPFLAVPGVWALISWASRLRQYDWTIFNKKNGDRAFAILHSKSNRSEIEMFEMHFVEAMKGLGETKNTANQAAHDTARMLADPGR